MRMQDMNSGETASLEELAGSLREQGCLAHGEALPLRAKDELHTGEIRVGYAVEDGAVQAFSARYCELQTLPATLGRLAGLRQAFFSGNRLTSLPETLGDLGRLRQLYLDHNQIAALPASIARLSGLEELYLDNNQLASL